MNEDLLTRVCCKSCRHYEKACRLKVKGWLGADPDEYFCKHWDQKEDTKNDRQRDN